MARPKNTEARSIIAQEAFRLFLARGYQGTTYEALAKAAGTSRTNVQYFFPKKSLLANNFFTRLLELAIEETGPKHQRSGTWFYEIGQRFFFFMSDEHYARSFFLDILSQRELTEDMVAFNIEWAFPNANEPLSVDFVTARENVIFAVGGFYELAYRALRSGDAFDVVHALGKMMVEFMRQYGYAYDEAEAFLADHVIAENDLVRFCRRAKEVLTADDAFLS